MHTRALCALKQLKADEASIVSIWNQLLIASKVRFSCGLDITHKIAKKIVSIYSQRESSAADNDG